MRMNPYCLLSGALLVFSLLGCQQEVTEVANSTVPMARVSPHEMEEHGNTRVDNYYWLRERDNPEVIDYLEAENAYARASMAHTQALQDELLAELQGRLQQDDASVPYRLDDYFYYTRFSEGQEYPIHCRKKGSLDAAEEILVDGNELAEGHGFFAMPTVRASSAHDVLAFATDTVGRRIYTLRFKDLVTGEILEDLIPEVTPNFAWAEDNKTLFYAKQDPQTLRFDRIYRHTLGTNTADDMLVYEETDDTFFTFVRKSKSRDYMLVGSRQTLSTEFRTIDAYAPESTPVIFEPRTRGHEYEIDHLGDYFYIRTNDAAPDFRLMRTSVGGAPREDWEEVIGHRDDVLLEGFELFDDYLVVNERVGGLNQLRIRPWSGEGEHYIDFDEPAYSAFIGINPDPGTSVLRYGYASLTTPKSVYDYDMATQAKALRKQEVVLGGFERDNYTSERIEAIARDGTRVPVSLVYRKGFEKDSTSPLLLYGYGSYGASMDARFNSSAVSLLDRGFVYAIAHIRGGQELGRAWYEDGKLDKKMNTFTDFIDVGDHLVKEGYADPKRVFALGGSAGGLLMGAVANMRPDLFKGMVAAVPFVDVVTTMLDDSIPLTTGEYDEWGNPNERDAYDYMLAYSPYDNVAKQRYPNLLVTTGLHDSQVQYWEPAKWVAKLRAMKTDTNRLILRTNMDAGHGGKSGRFRRFEEQAYTYAFLLDLAGHTATD